MPNNNPTGVGGFKKGQSGNPGGLRNKHIGDLSREARRYASFGRFNLGEDLPQRHGAQPIGSGPRIA